MTTWLKRASYSTTLFFYYVSITLQWLWLSVLVLPTLIKNESLSTILSPPQTSGTQLTPDFSLPEPIAIGFAVIVTILVLVITAVVLWRLPRAINTGATKVVHKATDSITPIVSHHRPLKPTEKKKLQFRIGLSLQTGVAVFPFAITILLPAMTSLEPRVIALVAGFLLVTSLVLLALSYALRPKRRTTSRTQSRASRG